MWSKVTTRRVRRVRKYVEELGIYLADVFQSVQNETYKKHALNNQQGLKDDTIRRNKVPAISSKAS